MFFNAKEKNSLDWKFFGAGAVSSVYAYSALHNIDPRVGPLGATAMITSEFPVSVPPDFPCAIMFGLLSSMLYTLGSQISHRQAAILRGQSLQVPLGV